MDQSVYGVDDTDYQEYQGHDDYVDFDELPNYLSDHEDVLDDAEEFDGWDMNQPSKIEATFGSKETAPVVNKDVNEDVVNETKPDPNTIWYGTDFDLLLGQDPVHAHIMKLVVENAVDPNIILYTKLNLVKLAAINKAKASNIEDAELASMMTAVSLAQKDETATRQTQNNEEKIMRDCIDQIHCLSKIGHLQDRVNATLRKLIKSSRYQLPSTINRHDADDLCGTLYALVSDNYYKTLPITAEVDSAPQADHVSDTNSDLEHQHQAHKHVPNPAVRFGINLITHLTLVGGLPMRSKKIYTIDRAHFENFKGNISECLKSSRSSQCHRLGVLTEKQMEHGDWLYQVATDMEKLDLKYTSWQLVDETSFKTFPFVKDTQVFLIHEYHQSIPARISEKVRGWPRVWNTWDLLVSPTLASPPAPEFVPCSGDMVLAPVSVGMTALSRALPSSHADGRKVGKKQGGKKGGEKKEEEREGEKKERRSKRYQQKASLAFRQKVE